LHFLNGDQFVQQIRCLLLCLGEPVFQLVLAPESLDHLRAMLLPVAENHLSQSALLVHPVPHVVAGGLGWSPLVTAHLMPSCQKGQADS